MRAVTAPKTVIALLALAACRIQDPFPCTLDEHCGSSGRCEPVGYCSFPDSACPEGRRYDELAGDGLAGACLDLGCPASYAGRLANTTSRYRVVDLPAPWLDAQNDCADDGAGTHLVVIESELERSGVAALIRDGIWIGYSDRAAEGMFRWVTGVASPFMPWDSGKPDDPDGTEDCTEQKRMMSAWDDQPCTDSLAYVCECDGIATDPTAF